MISKMIKIDFTSKELIAELTYIDWTFFAPSGEYYKPLKPWTIFFNILIVQII